MSINSLILDGGSLPFLALEDEVVLLSLPKVTLHCYPLMDNDRPNTKYEQKIEANARGFITTKRLIFLLFEPFQEVQTITIIYKQMVPNLSGEIPPQLQMPWLGRNYLTVSYKILPEQVSGNGKWLNYLYTWQCNIYLDGGRGNLDIFRVHDVLKKAIIEGNSRGPTENTEPLPAYSP
ncbi:LAFE_0E06590g1_1 [Lachancea fermentati]|uniref:LAFE_0E06590g1_1 n=1 Tax=Lachancea fermentati TaxID=4955 RepID=A0A1G4MD60_LACFM|nr:LAFE_0E06590g1_1 [Lachancea fermentati]